MGCPSRSLIVAREPAIVISETTPPKTLDATFRRL
jgi:hypothetical protein